MLETHEHFKEYTESSNTYYYTPDITDFSEHGVEDHYYECEIETCINRNIKRYSHIYKESCIMPDTGLMCLYINTDSGKDPSGRYVRDEGLTTGFIVSDKVKEPGQLQIVKNNTEIYNSGKYKKDKSGITIKLRGNGSAYKDKKPYKIKLQKKEDLLFRGDKKYKDKDWVLIAEGQVCDTLFGFERQNY